MVGVVCRAPVAAFASRFRVQVGPPPQAPARRPRRACVSAACSASARRASAMGIGTVGDAKINAARARST